MAKYSYEFKLQVVQAYLDFYFVRFCLAYRKPDSARIKFLLSFGFLV